MRAQWKYRRQNPGKLKKCMKWRAGLEKEEAVEREDGEISKCENRCSLDEVWRDR